MLQTVLQKISLPISQRAALRALLAVLFCASSVVLYAADSAAPVKLETRQTHSRLVFHVENAVPVQLKSVKGGFEILFKGVTLGDLGAPLGQEAQWKAELEKLTDSRVGELRFSETEAGVRVAGKWKFPSGANALADPTMEHFDYRDRDSASASGSYVIDFWLRKGPTLAEYTAAKKQIERFKSLKDAEEGAKKRAERRIAMEKLKAQTQDTMKFCRDSVSEQNDIFLSFMPVHQRMDFSRWLPVNAPDTNYTYYEPKTSAQDAQYMRLALKLYRKSKYGLTVRALDFLDTEFPASTFRNEARFLRANTYLKLGMQEDAEHIYKLIQAESKETPAALYIGMYMASKALAQNNHLAALEGFEWLIQNHSEHRLNWMFHMGAAESLYELKQAEHASQEYLWVAQHGPSAQIRAEAALKIGDMAMRRFQYEQALAGYFQGTSQFPVEAKNFPAAWINRGEALYAIGEYDRAEAAFKEYLKAYPGNPAGWRATMRLGEISARREPTADNQKAARDWYYETINRYPLSAGSTLARLRLLPCGDHGGMSFEMAKRFFDGEANDFIKKQESLGEVQISKYRDMRALSRFRSMIALGDEAVAVSVAVDELRSIGQTQGRTLIEKLLGSLFRKSILTFLAEGRKFDALKFYYEKGDMIPKDRRLLDSDFLLKLSQSAADLHLAQLAMQLFDDFRAAKGKSDAAIDAKKPLAAEDMDAVLERSEIAFTEAKALWILRLEGAEKGTREENAPSGRIRDLLAKVQDESPFSYERELILGLLEESEGNAARALPHAIKAQLLQPESGAAARDPRVDGWLASLERRAGDQGVALQMYGNLDKALSAGAKDVAKPGSIAEILGVPAAPELADVLLAEGELLEKKKDWSKAAGVYGRAIEAGLGGNKAAYGYANALLETGADREKALATLEKLGDDSKDRGPASASETPQQREERRKQQDFWKQLARERLANEKSRTQFGGNSN